MRRNVSSPDETPRRALGSIFDELRVVSSVDETLCRMLDITLEGEIKGAKMTSFSSDFKTLIKH